MSPRGFSSLGVSAYQPILGGRSGPWTLGARQPQGGEGASREDSAPDTASIHVTVEEAPQRLGPCLEGKGCWVAEAPGLQMRKPKQRDCFSWVSMADGQAPVPPACPTYSSSAMPLLPTGFPLLPKPTTLHLCHAISHSYLSLLTGVWNIPALPGSPPWINQLYPSSSPDPSKPSLSFSQGNVLPPSQAASLIPRKAHK